MTKTITKLLAAALATTAAAATPAMAVDINFTFSDGATTQFFSRTHVAGTVTGTLYGLVDNATSLPTSFAITASPDGLNFAEGSFSVFNSADSTGFTLTNGLITGANFFANFDDSANVRQQLRLNCTSSVACGGTAAGLNSLINNFTALSKGTGNQLGFPGATYSAVTATSAVPEPATWGMMILGFSAMGLMMRRRQKEAVSYAA